MGHMLGGLQKHCPSMHRCQGGQNTRPQDSRVRLVKDQSNQSILLLRTLKIIVTITISHVTTNTNTKTIGPLVRPLLTVVLVPELFYQPSVYWILLALHLIRDDILNWSIKSIRKRWIWGRPPALYIYGTDRRAFSSRQKMAAIWEQDPCSLYFFLIHLRIVLCIENQMTLFVLIIIFFINIFIDTEVKQVE